MSSMDASQTLANASLHCCFNFSAAQSSVQASTENFSGSTPKGNLVVSEQNRSSLQMEVFLYHCNGYLIQ